MSLNEVFDVPVTVIDKEETVVLPPDSNGNEEDVDYNVVRGNHYMLAQQAAEGAELALRVLRATENPRAIEALSVMLKTSSEINKQLLLLSKDRADIKTSKGTKSNTPVVNAGPGSAVFIGSSSDINKKLKEMKEGKDANA